MREERERERVGHKRSTKSNRDDLPPPANKKRKSHCCFLPGGYFTVKEESGPRGRARAQPSLPCHQLQTTCLKWEPIPVPIPWPDRGSLSLGGCRVIYLSHWPPSQTDPNRCCFAELSLPWGPWSGPQETCCLPHPTCTLLVQALVVHQDGVMRYWKTTTRKRSRKQTFISHLVFTIVSKQLSESVKCCVSGILVPNVCISHWSAMSQVV